MSSFGPRTLSSTGRAFDILADVPIWKTAGITFDWSTVTAVAVDTPLPDGITVKAGDKYVQYGTPVDRITVAAEVNTIDLSPGTDPTGGTFQITYNGFTTTPLAFNATGAVVQAALEALDNVQPGDVVVTGPAAFVYTLTWSGNLGNVNAVTVVNALTGADTPPAVGTTTQGNASGGMYGPVNTAATDGRQTMARGETFLTPWTVLMSESASDHFPVIEGGRVFAARLQVGGTNQATLANLLTAMPLLQIITDPG
jgi:hypothetical protein